MSKQANANDDAVVSFSKVQRGDRLDLLNEVLMAQSSKTIAFIFDGNGDEFAFGENEADIAFKVVGLPDTGRLPFAFVDGELRGADLALALFCPLIIASPKALIGSGFGRPGSSAVYVAAARRIGPVACERMLFRHDLLSAAELQAANLAVLAESLIDASRIAAARSSTMLSVAKANLVTWPLTKEGLLTLVDKDTG